MPVRSLARGLKGALETLRRDVAVARERDPAARSLAEVLLCYPGLHAMWAHRLAHRLYQRDLRLPARLVSQASRFLTGIEIHPGATIKPGLFIDHGMGAALERAANIAIDEETKAELLEQQHQALRWTYIGSGMTHPKFVATLGAMSPAARDRIAEVAPVFC